MQSTKGMQEPITVTKSDLPPLEKYVEYLQEIWQSRWLTNRGKFVQLLEQKIAAYLKVRRVLTLSNGTLAIQLALRALNLKGEIITTPFTFAATTNVILWEGLKPVFADISPDTFNIDPEDVRRKITPKTSAILAVHVYGNPCDVEELEEIAKEHNLKVIYDGAHAFGVEYKNRSVFEFGDITTLSFHATKVFHTIEGGAVICKDDAMYEKIQLLANHGIRSEEIVVMPGTNAKMNEFQAVMGLCNLEYLDEWIKKREMVYKRYKELLAGLPVTYQKLIASRYNYIYMPVLFENLQVRDKVYDELMKNGIKGRKYFYPLTVNFEYNKKHNLVKKYKLQHAKDVSDRVLCLPLYSTLSQSDVERIVGIVKDVISHA